MSKHKRRKKEDATSIGEAVGTSIDQGLLRAAATMGQQMMEQVLKTDPKIKLLVEQLVKKRLERALGDLGEQGRPDV